LARAHGIFEPQVVAAAVIHAVGRNEVSPPWRISLGKKTLSRNRKV